ncbi:hypothetical protein ACYULU_12065 [Breznakiellaceae bacterium SP9]
MACPNPTDPAYDADAVRAEVEAWLENTMIQEPSPIPGIIPIPNPRSIAARVAGSGNDIQMVENTINTGIATQSPATTIEANIITNLGIANLLIANVIIKNNELNLLNKKQYIAAANRNTKSVVAVSRTRARIG